MSNMLKLARVKWYLGQTLLPEHMVAQEQALGSEAYLRDRVEGLPESGIAEMRFNEQLLSDGVLSITALLAVMPDGTQMTMRGLTRVWRLWARLMKWRIIASVTSKSAMTPSFMGRMATMLPGVRPSISLASLPTATTRLVLPLRWTATTLGSWATIPRPLT